MRHPSGALQVAELLVRVAQRLFARRPGPREHHRAVVKELNLDLGRIRPVAQLRVDPRVLLADPPHADVGCHGLLEPAGAATGAPDAVLWTDDDPAGD